MRVRRAAFIAAVVGIAGGSLGSWAPASASGRVSSVKNPSSIIVTSQTVAVTSSTHRALRLTVASADFVSTSGPNDSLGEIHATLGTPNGHESHTWVFELSAGSFTDDVTTSIGTVDTGATQMAPYGQISLTFTPVGHLSSTLTCGKTSVTTRRMAISATMVINTKSTGKHRWGHVGTLAHPTDLGSHGSLRTQYGGAECPPVSNVTHCMTNVAWNAGHGDVTLSGGWSLVHGKRHGEVVGDRQDFLGAPDGAVRFDEVTAKVPAPALTVSHGKADLHVTTSGSLATGSARLRAPHAAKPEKLSCSKTHHEVQTDWSNTRFNNAISPLTVHEQIEGRMVVPNLAHAGSIARSHKIN